MSDISLYDRPRYYDLQLPKTFDQLLIYQFQGYVLDTNKRIIARLETKRFQIMPFRGYQTFPIEKIFKSPKKHLRWE